MQGETDLSDLRLLKAYGGAVSCIVGGLTYTVKGVLFRDTVLQRNFQNPTTKHAFLQKGGR